MTRYEKLDEMLQALAKKAGAEWYAIIEEGQEEPHLYSYLGIYDSLEDKAFYIAYLNAIANRGHTIVNVKLSNGLKQSTSIRKKSKLYAITTLLLSPKKSTEADKKSLLEIFKPSALQGDNIPFSFVCGCKRFHGAVYKM